jgi:hypothetical protein
MFTKKYKEFINRLIKHKKITVYFLLTLLFLLTFFPRSVEVLNQNPVFGFDQGRDYLAAKSIIADHKITLIGAELGAGSAGLSGIFQGPGFFYLLTIPFILFNGNPAGGTVLMLILSILAVIVGFMLGRKLFGKIGGLIAALLIAIAPIFISQARFIWNPHAPTLFILLTFYFLYLAIQGKRNIFIFLTAFFAGFIYNLEFGVSIPLCLSIAIFSVYLFRLQFKKYLVLFMGYIIAFSPMIFFEIRHHFPAFTGLISYISNPDKIAGPPNSSFIISHAQSFIYIFQQTFPLSLEFSYSLVLWGLLILLSLFFISREKNQSLRKFLIFLILLIPVAFLVFYFLKNAVWVYYLTELSIAYIFLFTYVLYASYIRKFYKLNLSLVLFTAILIIVALNSSYKTTLYDYTDYGGTVKLMGKMDAVDFIYKSAKGKPFGVMIFAPGIYTYPYEYILWWYGKEKYHYMPYMEKKGHVYLLIEIDPEKPWTYRGWLETVIKNGTILDTVTLPSGFMVQERVFN